MSVQESVWFTDKDITEPNRRSLKRPSAVESQHMRRLLTVFKQDLEQHLDTALGDRPMTQDAQLQVVNQFAGNYLGQWKIRGVVKDHVLTKTKTGCEILFQWTDDFNHRIRYEWSGEQ